MSPRRPPAQGQLGLFPVSDPQLALFRAPPAASAPRPQLWYYEPSPGDCQLVESEEPFEGASRAVWNEMEGWVWLPELRCVLHDGTDWNGEEWWPDECGMIEVIEVLPADLDEHRRLEYAIAWNHLHEFDAEGVLKWLAAGAPPHRADAATEIQKGGLTPLQAAPHLERLLSPDVDIEAESVRLSAACGEIAEAIKLMPPQLSASAKLECAREWILRHRFSSTEVRSRLESGVPAARAEVAASLREAFLTPEQVAPHISDLLAPGVDLEFDCRRLAGKLRRARAEQRARCRN